MASSGALYSNEADVLKRQVHAEVGANQVDPGDVKDIFEISRCTTYIQENNHKYVGLQFPDSLIVNSTLIVAELEKHNTTVNFFILADTSYGNCDVDEVNGQHINVDLIIHYGDASLHPTAKTPTLFVFEKCNNVDTKNLNFVFHEKFQRNSRIVMLYDLSCVSVIKNISTALIKEYPYMSIGSVKIPTSPMGKSNQNMAPEEANIIKELCVKACPGCSCRLDENDEKESADGTSTHANECKDVKAGYFKIPIEVNKNIDDYVIFYIGPNDSIFLKQFSLEHPCCEIYLYDSNMNTLTKYNSDATRQLMRRYYLVEKAKDAKTVGILVGTMGIAGYLDSITHMKKLIKFSHKKSYTFIMGKLNIQKLANFMEIDIFVLIASAENCLQDYKEFFKPVITPYELEVACNPNREWSSEYVLDFRELLPTGNSYVLLPEKNNEEVTVSLITGSIRGRSKENEINEIENMTIIQSHQKDVDVYHPNSAVNFLKERSWTGLSPDIGTTAVQSAKPGRSGIAASYANEPNF